MIGDFRYLVSKLLPGDTTSGVMGGLIKGFGDVVNLTAKMLQGIDPLWEEDAEFMALFRENRANLALDKKRAYILFKLAKQCVSLPGDYAELGVYKGGGSKIIATSSGNAKMLYMFDTFEGFPETHADFDPYWQKGQLGNVSFEAVKKAFEKDRVTFVKGMFPSTVSQVDPSTTFAFVHIDTDLYRPTLDGCQYFYPRLPLGGIILFDDYGFLSCPGVKRAVNEFFANKKEQVIYLPTGQAMVVKLPT